jgi:hypothetical protein
VNQKIVRDAEIRRVASVTKIGDGTYGDVYKICAKTAGTEELTTSENPLRVQSPTYGVSTELVFREETHPPCWGRTPE